MGLATPPRELLVATDLSQPADVALTRAVQLANQHGAHITALHVLPADIDDDVAEHARRNVETHLSGRLDGASVTVAIRRGKADREIAAEAADSAAELVVVGAHGAHWPADAFLGSTAENVVRTSPVPVLLAKKRSTVPYRTVVLAVDICLASDDAARFATGLTPGADHLVIHAGVVIGENLLRMHGVGDEEIELLRRTCTVEAREYIARLIDTLPEPPKQVVITSGHPATRLVELCDSHAADLVVVGTGTRSPASYALLGSVAQQVMRRSKSDVLVVPAVKI
ncbi:universal stress protein [Mycolicibacterium hippocampi]|uniref:UspA domain-containing protein n=1 Tax=Mycolicibacterium hippocampi TaxID=659824 RepID=A0A7I9ZHD2_9MYCO|nr:universal stress protein [Mycolicibacterium hippocampi]GFH00269.1 hypothetical protein MHIP_07520 [Mycolicibacterium hippocampi]